MKSKTQYEYDKKRHRKHLRLARKLRWLKRRTRAINYPAWIEPKYGVRPLSILHPSHPARLYGWDDERTATRDKTRWE